MKITVLGSGSWGTALARLLVGNGYDVILWSYSEDEYHSLMRHRENIHFLPGMMLPDALTFSHDVSVVRGADIIVCATPSFAVRSVMKMASPMIEDGQIILNVSKGIETDSLSTLAEVIACEVPQAALSVMSGPSHAEEVAQELPTTNVVASHSKQTAERIQDVFMNQYFRVYTNPDVIGVELGGSLKNVIALCAGISDGLGFGDNTKAALMTRGMVEIIRLGVAMGGLPETFHGLSGMGDLIVTCTSKHSRNRRAGIYIGEGLSAEATQQKIKMVVEGINTCKAAKHLADKMGVEMPIVSQAYQILFEGKSPREATMALMGRNKRHETEVGFLMQ